MNSSHQSDRALSRLVVVSYITAALLAVAIGLGAAIALGAFDSEPIPVERSMDAYIACVEGSDTDDPEAADRECAQHLP
jgi:hypothetical protein